MGVVAFPGKSLEGRALPRVRVVMPCMLSWPGSDVIARTRDLSYSGIALVLPDDTRLKIQIEEKAHIRISNRITLEVVTVHSCREQARLVAGFKVITIERGAEQWKALIDTVGQ